MIRRTCLILSLALLLSIVWTFPQQPKSRRPIPQFKVCRPLPFLFLLERKQFFSPTFRTRPGAWNCRTTPRWSGRISLTTSPVRTEFTDTTPTWRTIVKFSTFACRRPGARPDGASSAPRRRCSIKWVVKFPLLLCTCYSRDDKSIRLGDVRLHENGKLYTVRGIREILQLERGDRQGGGGRGKRRGAERIGRGTDFEQTTSQDIEDLESKENVAGSAIVNGCVCVCVCVRAREREREIKLSWKRKKKKQQD